MSIIWKIKVKYWVMYTIFFGLDPDVHSNNTNIKGKKRPKWPKKQQQPTKPKYSSYYWYEFPAVQTFSDLWEMLGVNTRESSNLTDNSSILERCIVYWGKMYITWNSGSTCK